MSLSNSSPPPPSRRPALASRRRLPARRFAATPVAGACGGPCRLRARLILVQVRRHLQLSPRAEPPRTRQTRQCAPRSVSLTTAAHTAALPPASSVGGRCASCGRSDLCTWVPLPDSRALPRSPATGGLDSPRSRAISASPSNWQQLHCTSSGVSLQRPHRCPTSVRRRRAMRQGCVVAVSTPGASLLAGPSCAPPTSRATVRRRLLTFFIDASTLSPAIATGTARSSPARSPRPRQPLRAHRSCLRWQQISPCACSLARAKASVDYRRRRAYASRTRAGVN